MVSMDIELIEKLREFQNKFGDIVPLRELPATVTNQELIDAIETAIKTGTNDFATRFGYAVLEKDANIDV